MSAKECRPECRGVAQPGSASALGAEGRRFESSLPDHFSAVSSPSRKGRNGNERRTADACTNSAYGIVPEQPIGYVTLRQRIELRRAIENGPVKDRHILSDDGIGIRPRASRVTLFPTFASAVVSLNRSISSRPGAAASRSASRPTLRRGSPTFKPPPRRS